MMDHGPMKTMMDHSMIKVEEGEFMEGLRSSLDIYKGISNGRIQENHHGSKGDYLWDLDQLS